MSDRRLILLGGSAGTGKSTVAAELTRRRSAGWLQLDTLWLTVMNAAGERSPLRTVLDVDHRLRHGDENADELLTAHVAASETLCAALPSALSFELQSHQTLVVDGAWLLPAFVAGLVLPATDIRAAVLHEADPDALAAAMISRRGRTQVAPWHDRSVMLAHAYGDWVAQQARAHGVPVLPSRPWSSLLSRLESLV